MTVLGSLIINMGQQNVLANGILLDGPRKQILPRILARARVGDLLWVKEDFQKFSPVRGGLQTIEAYAPGPIMKFVYPAHLKNLECKIQRRPGRELHRGASRATLEIIALGVATVRFLVHMMQVDAFLKARKA